MRECNSYSKVIKLLGSNLQRGAPTWQWRQWMATHVRPTSCDQCLRTWRGEVLPLHTPSWKGESKEDEWQSHLRATSQACWVSSTMKGKLQLHTQNGFESQDLHSELSGPCQDCGSIFLWPSAVCLPTLGAPLSAACWTANSMPLSSFSYLRGTANSQATLNFDRTKYKQSNTGWSIVNQFTVSLPILWDSFLI